ncbi:diguanylate cyclase [Spirochaetia bacterium]|nr:diguanylate cyclase [Spirochaetia bacterium]
MKNSFLVFAKYNEAADEAAFSILNGLSNEEREKDRGSYFGSLSGLARHVAQGTRFFLGIFKGVLGNNAAALKALSVLDSELSLPEGPLNDAQWKSLAAAVKAADAAFVKLVEALNPADFQTPVPTEWYGGNPPAVPLSFMLQSLVTHNAHHRGQISQILDSLKIDNDFSGINAAFLK